MQALAPGSAIALFCIDLYKARKHKAGNYHIITMVSKYLKYQ
jgi:hypothetical protein